MTRKLKWKTRRTTVLVLCLSAVVAAVAVGSFGGLASASGNTPPGSFAKPIVESPGHRVGERFEVQPGVWQSRKYWLGIGEGAATSVNGTKGPLTMSGTTGGVQVIFTCEAQFTSAAIENAASKAFGTGTGKITLSGCKGESAKTLSCKITPSSAKSVTFNLGDVEGEREGEIEPDAVISPSESSGKLVEFSTTGCGVEGLNQTWALSGTVLGYYSNASSRIEFPASGGFFLNGSIPATVTGALGLSTTAGAGIKAEQVSFAYAWKRCSGGSCQTIIGAIAPTYTPTAADVGKTLKAVVLASNNAGSTSIESWETEAITN